jgi:flagellar hook-basal body complex protein FliE
MSEVGIRSDVQSVLAQMKLMRAQAEAGIQQTPQVDEAGPGAPNGSFATMLKTATDSVNALQEQSSALTTQFVRGDSNDLVGAMIAGQKATVAFQGLVHTRNQLINAYQEIMKMAI